MNICTCGRAFSHCRFCGSRNLYKQKQRSLNRTIELGRAIEVHSCKKCGADTDESLVCVAPSFEAQVSNFVSEKSERPAIGTEEYLEASKIRLNELLFTKLTIEKAVAKMQSEGWVISFEEPVAPQEAIATPIIESATEITMDDVMQKMKEQSDRDAKRDTNIDLNAILERMRKK